MKKMGKRKKAVVCSVQEFLTYNSACNAGCNKACGNGTGAGGTANYNASMGVSAVTK